MVLYQVGGYRGTVPRHGGEHASFAQAIMNSRLLVDGELELVLGIRNSGASALLIGATDFDRAGLRQFLDYRRRDPPSPGDFLSFSPIEFRNATELSDKLRKLQPKPGNKAFDNSQLNKQYCAAVSIDINIALSRAAFEDARLLRRIIRTRNFNSEKFGLGSNPPWVTRLKMRVLVVDSWSRDQRSRPDIMQAPRILDIGMAQLDPTTLVPLDRTLRHVKCKENINFSNTGEEEFPLGKKEITADECEITVKKEEEVDDSKALAPRTEILSEVELHEQILAFCEPERDSPTVLLVHNRDLTMGVLRNAHRRAGVPEERLNQKLDQLYGRNLQSLYGERFVNQSSRNDPRSRSPQRSNYDQRQRDFHDVPSPSVHIVDVNELFRIMTTLNQTEYTPSLRRNAEWLGIPDINPSGWCAGNEVKILVDVFRIMADGPAIDDQREMHLERRRAHQTAAFNPMDDDEVSDNEYSDED